MSRSRNLPVATHAVYIRYGALLREQDRLCRPNYYAGNAKTYAGR